MRRNKTAAESLSKCSVNTLRAHGVDWKSCHKSTLSRFRERRRDREWLARFTGFSACWSIAILSAAGVKWMRATRRQIAQAITAHQRKLKAQRSKATVRLTVRGKRVTLDEFARRVGVEPRVLRRRHRKIGSWSRVVEASLACPGRWSNGSLGHIGERGIGRPPRRVEIDGETRLYSEWLSIVDLTKQGIWKAAKRSGRTTTEELTVRVRARRSDAVHAPASTAVASDQPPRVVRGDRVASACAASERGAVANDSKEAAA